MKVEEFLKVAGESGSENLAAFVTTLRNAKLAFEPIESESEKHRILAADFDSTVIQKRVNPKLLSFLIVCIFIGSVFTAIIPGRSKAPDIVTTVIMVIGYWLLFGVAAYLICKIFSGQGSLVHTLSVNLQVFAVVYVLSSFAALLWGTVITGLVSVRTATYLRGLDGEKLINDPVYAYFLVQFVLLSIYVPLANCRVHGLTFSRVHKITSKGPFSVVISLAQPIFLSAVLILLTLIFCELNKTNYQAHKVLLGQPEITKELEAKNLAFVEPKNSPDVSANRGYRDSTKQRRPITYAEPDGTTAGYYYDSAGRLLGSTGVNDGRVYLVTSEAEAQRIRTAEKLGDTTPVDSIPSAIELLSHQVRQAIAEAVGRSNNPTPGDAKGSFHEEGGFVETNAAAPGSVIGSFHTHPMEEFTSARTGEAGIAVGATDKKIYFYDRAGILATVPLKEFSRIGS
jgi:YD repeat-containing protein